jgi:ABC-2 type transport system permease protein
MNIFFRELKANFKSLLIWGGIIILFIWIGFSKFTAYYGNPELLAIFDSMPPAVLAAFQFEAFNLTTVTGFFGVMFIYFALILSIAAAMWGSDIITKEVRDKTVEFSLTLPVSRSRLVTAKIFAAIVNCVGLLLVTVVALLLNIGKYQPEAEFFAFMRLSIVAIFIMQMIFLALGVFLACAMKEHKRANSIAVSIILATYFVSIIIGLDDKLDFLKYFSPFAYFNPAELLHGARIEPVFLALAGGIIAVSFVGAYASYARRDLYI